MHRNSETAPNTAPDEINNVMTNTVPAVNVKEHYYLHLFMKCCTGCNKKAGHPVTKYGDLTPFAYIQKFPP